MHGSSNSFDWNENAIARLRTLWAEGRSTSEIGRELGVSKNAVVGKTNRLQLTPRPSPIRNGSPAAPRAPRRPRPPKLDDIMPLEAVGQPAAAQPEPQPSASLQPGPGAPPTDQHAVRVEATAPNQPRTTANGRPCCWPLGDPGTAGFRYCDEPAFTGKPYCELHVQLAYVPARRRYDEGRDAAG